MAASDKKNTNKVTTLLKQFLVGSLSGMCGTSVIQPIDFTKVQIQLASQSDTPKGPTTIIREIYASGGPRAFYSGLDSALLRQVIYCGGRIGLYLAFTDMVRARKDG